MLTKNMIHTHIRYSDIKNERDLYPVKNRLKQSNIEI